MRKYDFEESSGYWLIIGSHAYHRALTEELAPHGITLRQMQVIGLINHRGPLTQADLAEAMMIEPPSLVGVLDRMEAANLIRRTTRPDDRRKRIIELTKDAGAVWDIICDCALEVRKRATKGLSERQVSQLRKTIEKILSNLGEE